ncbi:MAG: hypothetical protein HQK79_18620, partial [Desulfobacterales bacterium]|nr:hypothetical protein [Desulfobacterales bacterium]
IAINRVENAIDCSDRLDDYSWYHIPVAISEDNEVYMNPDDKKIQDWLIPKNLEELNIKVKDVIREDNFNFWEQEMIRDVHDGEGVTHLKAYDNSNGKKWAVILYMHV